MTDYFINFAPADAVQWAPSGNALEGVPSEILRFLSVDGKHFGYGYGDGWTMMFGLPNGSDLAVDPGQWLVRQGARVWVQDEEPARVVRWETGRMSPGGDVWDHDWLSWWPEYRRPVLSNGWTGPWSPIEGGAE